MDKPKLLRDPLTAALVIGAGLAVLAWCFYGIFYLGEHEKPPGVEARKDKDKETELEWIN